MKKLALTGLLLFPLFAFSQITWGAKGGANIATLGDFNSGNEPILRLHGGFYYQQRLEQQYAISAELLYSMQGARAANISRRYLAYNYINLPVLLKFYNINDAYLEVGPQFGYLISAKYHDDGFVRDEIDVVKRFDFTGLIGGGKETDFGNYGARVGFGFTNTSGAGVGGDIVFRNLLLQVYVGFTLGQVNE